MSMWDEAAEAAKKYTNQGGLFLRLADDGDKALVVFMGEPQPQEVVWTGDGHEPYDADKHGKDKKPSLRIKINVFNTTEKQMQIWDMNSATFKSLLQLRAKYGLGKVYEVTRNGKKGDPKTTYMILPEQDIGEALAERLKAEQLHDLTKDDSGGNSASKNRELLVSILKALQPALLQKFCDKFGPKIRDIPDEKLVDALAAAHELKTTSSETKPAVDPFA